MYENEMITLWAGMSFVVIVFLLALIVLAFLLPFFVFRIRNESIRTNKKLDQVIALLAATRGGENCQPAEDNAVHLSRQEKTPEETRPEDTWAYKAGRRWKKITAK